MAEPRHPHPDARDTDSDSEDDPNDPSVDTDEEWARKVTIAKLAAKAREEDERQNKKDLEEAEEREQGHKGVKGVKGGEEGEEGPMPDELTDVFKEAREGRQDSDNGFQQEDSAVQDPVVEEKENQEEDGERKAKEEAMSQEEIKTLRSDAQSLKATANDDYRAGRYEQAVDSYSAALDVCPLRFKEDRAIFYANRAAARISLSLPEAALADCTAALQLNPDYVRALTRRGQLYEESNKPHEALADFQHVLKIDPGHREANLALQRLPAKVAARDEEIKAEMFGNLKKLGNMVLNPFGMSTENFQFVQDPNSGSYSVNFKK